MSLPAENPPQKAVALSYDGEGAPKVSAKGFGNLAEDIIALAQEHDIPINENSELVNVLAQLQVGEEVPHELYVAIAEVIAFAYFLKGKISPQSLES